MGNELATSIRRVASMLLLLMTGMVAGCQANDEAQVVFAHNTSEARYEIYSADIANQTLELLATITPQEHQESFALVTLQLSPQGTHLAYFDLANLYVLNLLTETVQEVSDSAIRIGPRSDVLAWSPDGTMLAFFGESTTSSEAIDAYVYDLEAERTRNVTQGQLRLTQPHFAWSPDSQLLALPTLPGPKYTIVEVASGTVIQDIELELPVTYPGTLSICNPEWSQNGRYFAFAVGCSTVEPALWYETYVMDVEIGSVVPVTNLMSIEDSGTVIATMYPKWSPGNDVLLVAYTYGRPPFLETPSLPSFIFREIILFDPVEQRITTLPSDTILPLDGTSIAWGSGNDVIWNTEVGWVRVAVNGIEFSDIDQVGAPTGCSPVWSPDGSTFAYTGTNDLFICPGIGDQPVWVISATSGATTEVTASLGGHNLLLGWMNP